MHLADYNHNSSADSVFFSGIPLLKLLGLGNGKLIAAIIFRVICMAFDPMVIELMHHG